MNKLSQLQSYDYTLPPELIATSPTYPKEQARLLVYERTSKRISHFKFKDLPELIPQNTALIFNDTKVIKARLLGHKASGGASEIMLNHPLQDGLWSAFVRGKVRLQSEILIGKELIAIVKELIPDGSRVLEFKDQNGAKLMPEQLLKIVQKIGQIPLPPYIKREANAHDESWYQSIFATTEGAVAAPTASLHFSQELLKQIKAKHQIAYLTLHIGAGTFKGVQTNDIKEHQMHKERFNIPDETANLIKSDKKILGVGTTVTRVVEDFARNGVQNGECKLFLNPLNPPIRQNYLLTNFHLPKSTLIMLVAGFVGLEATHKIYSTAIDNGYKFYSYGDGMLVL